MTQIESQKVHATSVAIHGHGIMIRGKSGSGKSDLALRLIDRGAVLISDDYCVLTPGEDKINISPPPTIAGKIEVASIGIIKLDYVSDVPLRIIVQLKKSAERFPMDSPTSDLLGYTLPTIVINPMEPSAPIKVEMAIRYLPRLKG
ncbi:HPr kinase/phosphorylase [Parasphingorhabdus halotolerans]|uniref:Aldolase n=1 Tax=Parasphingorhabdus halotolerans TaxID=2725558 RepID=A0A6H2DJ64_9SPHN|nr:HPr kinase/phosphatase C-terminal domain-containing protein [Parasphingorhabdus halotolerans]QJB68430.1 aldolase [Parasphingorhabdus halotolerans]